MSKRSLILTVCACLLIAGGWAITHNLAEDPQPPITEMGESLLDCLGKNGPGLWPECRKYWCDNCGCPDGQSCCPCMCGVGGTVGCVSCCGGTYPPERASLLESIEIAHNRSGLPSIGGVLAPDKDGKFPPFMLERIERPFGGRSLGGKRDASRERGVPQAIVPLLPTGACDTDAECETETDNLCDMAGHGGVNPDTVQIIHHADGNGATCSGDCNFNGAVAFVTCGATKIVLE